jgi:hypothetical protein
MSAKQRLPNVRVLDQAIWTCSGRILVRLLKRLEAGELVDEEAIRSVTDEVTKETLHDFKRK